MPTNDEAEKALKFLQDTGRKVEEIATQARLKSHMLKHVEGLLVIQSNQPVTVRKESARAQKRWLEAAEEDAIAHGQEQMLKERRDAAKIAISLYQSETRDRK
jgi:hypothetical protein